MVSILIPVYNSENYINRCLDSIIAQTFKNIEIIIIDDGSTDSSLSIVRQYAERDEKFRVFSQENKGVAAARNAGLRRAIGEYILYVDSDDWLEADAIEHAMARMTEDIDIVFFGSDSAISDEETRHESHSICETWDRERQILEFMKHKRMTGMLWNKLIRRSLTDGIYFNEATGYGEDAEFLWKILKKSNKMLVTNEVLYHHVIEEDSISHLSFSERKYSAIPMWESINKEIRKYYPELINLARERLMCSAVFSMYEIKKSGYRNQEQEDHIKEIVKENIAIFMKSPNVSKKMKLWALAIRGGYYQVSVIIPIYNTDKYLDRCLSSIMNQSYKDITVIMIDDGSTDSSGKIAAEYEKKDERFFLFTQNNFGVSAARNNGLDLVISDYVLFVDSDDWLEKQMIEILVSNIKRDNSDISCCQYDRGFTHGLLEYEKWDFDSFIRKFLIHKDVNGSLVNKLIKFSVIKNIRFNVEIRYGEDALFLWKVLNQVDSMAITNKVLYHVTLHDDSASGGGSYKQIRRDCVVVWYEIEKEAQLLGKEYGMLAGMQVGNMAFYSLYEMFYYEYKNINDENYFKKALSQHIKEMKNSDFISLKETIFAMLMLYNTAIARKLIRLRGKIRNRKHT